MSKYKELANDRKEDTDKTRKGYDQLTWKDTTEDPDYREDHRNTEVEEEIK